MGKWRRYEVGRYRLGQLNGRAVAVWRDEDGKHRIRLDATTEAEARAALDRYARRRTVLEARESKTVADLFALTDHVIEWDAAPVASIRKGFSEACRRANLTGVVPHTLRHTHATLALESGVEIERISRQLGHRDSATTRGIYLHPSADYSAPSSQAVGLKIVKG